MYTIQEFAGLSGVSIDRLRHYEKLNLMKPGRNERNGYRYYSDDDLLDVYRICFMQSLNVPLKDIPKEMTARKAEERIAKRIGEMEAEIARLRLHIERLTSICNELGHPGEAHEQPYHTQKHDVLYYEQIRQNAKGKDIIAQWMRHTPLVYPFFEIDTDTIREQGNDCLHPRMGLAIDARYAEELGFDRTAPGIEEEESIALTYRMRLVNPMNPMAEEFAGMLDYCRENSIDLRKRLFYRISVEKYGDEGYGVQVCMPV